MPDRDWSEILHSAIGQSPHPLFARWYTQRHGTAWFRAAWQRTTGETLTDDEIQAARLVSVAIIRARGVDPYSRTQQPRLSDLTAKAAPEKGQPAVSEDLRGDVWTLMGDRIRTLDGLLDAADVDRDRWAVESWRANSYEAQAKGGGITQLWQVKANLRERPEWMWRAAEPRETYQAPDVTDPATTLVIPDSQNGYRWVDDHKRLEPLHDRRAWDLAVQIARAAQPDRIVLLGDMVDFAEGSKRWPVSDDLRATTQPTIQELHWWLAELRAACPSAVIVYLEGNHEDRIDRALSQLTPELHGLRAANESEPLISWRRLLALDALGVEYGPTYSSAGAVTLHPDCEATHGHKVAAGGGATVARVVRQAHVSQIFGHIHRCEYAARTLHGPEGRRVVWAASPGTLCRVDGVVPAVSGRVDWQQGLAWLTHVDGSTHCSLTPIRDGVAVWRGEALAGRDRGEEIAEATGLGYLR